MPIGTPSVGTPTGEYGVSVTYVPEDFQANITIRVVQPEADFESGLDDLTQQIVDLIDAHPDFSLGGAGKGYGVNGAAITPTP